ncbi:MAG: hypothetical protein WEE50_08835 [Chloroflexota bacterium]
MRRLRSIGVMLLAAAAALSAVTPALAKSEDAVVMLDAALPGDAQPGTEVEIGWTVAIAEDDGSMQPFSAEGVFVRLLPSSGEPVEFAARQDRAGHYVATITVPNGGVGEIEIGLRGTACTTDGQCQRADEMFNLAENVAGAGIGAEAAPLPAGGETTGISPDPTAAPAITPFLPLVLTVAAVAVVAAMVVLIVLHGRGRRPASRSTRA